MDVVYAPIICKHCTSHDHVVSALTKIEKGILAKVKNQHVLDITAKRGQLVKIFVGPEGAQDAC